MECECIYWECIYQRGRMQVLGFVTYVKEWWSPSGFFAGFLKEVTSQHFCPRLSCSLEGFQCTNPMLLRTSRNTADHCTSRC